MLEFKIDKKLESIEDVSEFVNFCIPYSIPEYNDVEERGSDLGDYMSLIKPKEYDFIYKVLKHAIKSSYKVGDPRRYQLIKYLADYELVEYHHEYSATRSYDAFKNIMFQVLKAPMSEYEPIFVILICFINDGKPLQMQNNNLLSRLLYSENYLELFRYKFIILQLRYTIDTNSVFSQFSDYLLKKLPEQLWENDYRIDDNIEYQYLERYDINFNIPEFVIEKLRINLMINDYLNALRKAVQTNSSGSASLTEYIYAASAGNKDKNSKIEFFLEETNDINNEWIIKQEDPNGNQFLIASPFNNFIRDGFIRKINADFIDNGYDDVTIIEPLKQKTITETSFFMKLPDHILKSVLAKLSNRQLFDILTINKRLTNIICEILYYRPYVSNLQKLQKLEMTLLKSSLNLTKLPYYIYVKRLNFSFFNHLIDRYTLRNVSCCKLVERLTLVNCHGVTGSDVSFFVDSLNNNVLTSLDLSGVTNLNDVTIMALVNKCSVSLQGLYVPNLNCNNKFLIELVKNCFNLKRLRLNNCIPMDNTIAVNISNYLNRLVELDLSGCESINSDSVFQILVKLTNLRDLNLNGCKKLESKFIALLYDANKKLHKLKNLDIGNLNNYSSFKDSDIKKLVSIASNLKHLTLSKHKELTNDSLKYISKLNKTLTTLNIGHLVKITDIGISYLLDCSKLTYLDLSSCERISSDGLISLSVFKRLKRLGLVKCSQLDDYTLLIFLAKTQSKLERVHLSYCQQLTGFSILELLRRHINIQHLSVSGIPAIRSISPLIKKYSRPSPANFTSEQRVSFAIFSGYKDVNSFKRVLNDTLVDKSITEIFNNGFSNKTLFDGYLKYSKYKDLNFIELLKFNIEELITANIAYDYLVNRYDINTINYNEEVIILELKMILDSNNGNNVLNIKSLSNYFNGVVEYKNIINENGNTIKNSSLKDFKAMIDELDTRDDEDEEKNEKNRKKQIEDTIEKENIDQDMLLPDEVLLLINDNNQLLTALKKSLETWENNLLSYLTIPSQRASMQQFQRIDSNMMLLKVLYNNLSIIKKRAERSDIEIWAQQIKPILSHITNKFEQLSLVSFFKELITLISSIKSHELINNWSVIINLTSNLRDNILKFRMEDYTLKNEYEKFMTLKQAKDKFLTDLVELGSLVTGNESIEFFPGFNL